MWLVEYADVEPRVRRANKSYMRIFQCAGGILTHSLHVVQSSAMLTSCLLTQLKRFVLKGYGILKIILLSCLLSCISLVSLKQSEKPCVFVSMCVSQEEYNTPYQLHRKPHHF